MVAALPSRFNRGYISEESVSPLLQVQYTYKADPSACGQVNELLSDCLGSILTDPSNNLGRLPFVFHSKLDVVYAVGTQQRTEPLMHFDLEGFKRISLAIDRDTASRGQWFHSIRFGFEVMLLRIIVSIQCKYVHDI